MANALQELATCCCSAVPWLRGFVRSVRGPAGLLHSLEVNVAAAIFQMDFAQPSTNLPSGHPLCCAWLRSLGPAQPAVP